MRILDACAGPRGIWLNKEYADATYIDVQERHSKYGDTYPGNLLMDCRHTDFPDGHFDLVIFDPPHLANGPNGALATRYGSFSTDYIRNLVYEAFREFHRILRPDGLVAFKWNDHDTPLARILARITGFDALVGVRVAQRIRHESETSWVLLRRTEKIEQLRLPSDLAVRGRG